MTPRRTAIVNIGTLVTGDLGGPVADAEALFIEDGAIASIGSADGYEHADQVIDANGATVGPGLIDSHCHVVIGDFTPRQNVVGFLSSYVHGGITQVISPGEIHAPGRPHDADGVVALAVFAQRSWSNYRPNGMKVNGGAVVLEPTLQPEHFRYLADQGGPPGQVRVRPVRGPGRRTTAGAGGAGRGDQGDVPLRRGIHSGFEAHHHRSPDAATP